MALTEATRSVNVTVQVASSVAGALQNRFCIWEGTSPNDREVITHVPGALGAASVGILAENVDTDNGDGFRESSMIIPDGGIAKVELGEAVVTVGSALRVGGNAGEVDGAAYLANATGDVIVGYALETGSAGEICSIQYVGFAGTAP
jgi:hypothetical protein